MALFIAVESQGADVEDAEIAALLARGDRETAFNRLFRTHWAKVSALGFRLTQDPAEASDIAQDTFILVHRGLAGYRGEGRLLAWLMKIALHVALKERARRKRWKLDGTGALESLPAPGHRNEIPDERLGQAMSLLPDDQRAVLSLFAVEGLRHAAIAEVLGVPEGTVWSRLHHARKRLQEVLKERS